MKSVLTKIFWPLLKSFETDKEPAGYKKSHRMVLVIMGSLFGLLGAGSGAAAVFVGELVGLLPAVVFFMVGLTAVVVGTLGSNGAVAKIWGSK